MAPPDDQVRPVAPMPKRMPTGTSLLDPGFRVSPSPSPPPPVAVVDDDEAGGLPHKSTSTLSLTASALFGIFGTSLTDPSRAPTPDVPVSTARENSTTYAAEVARRRQPAIRSSNNKQASHLDAAAVTTSSSSVSSSALAALGRMALLFSLGVAYGHLVTQLQDNHLLTTATLNVDPTGRLALSWGALGVVLGALLPLVDSATPQFLGPPRRLAFASGMTAWSPIVRAVGIFMSVSYGIKHLPWTSTLQEAVMLALLNPVLWFVMDASANGFVLSSLTAIFGTAAFAWMYPGHLPAASAWSEDYISVTTWIASVFFCSSVCFGAIGRKLLVTKSR
ncbi:insulin-induced protein-domain-containing protein [Limtongia smithiae]|uniref:insulin-induced protein-domain-containing protein n=1 Tax=Limtongia smithiae TaxID=1125753 RepID=UPI0034CDEEBD